MTPGPGPRLAEETGRLDEQFSTNILVDDENKTQSNWLYQAKEMSRLSL